MVVFAVFLLAIMLIGSISCAMLLFIPSKKEKPERHIMWDLSD